MKRPTTWVRPGLKEYKIQIFILIIALTIIAYPIYLFSSYISQFFVINIDYRAGNEVISDEKLDIEIYDNFFQGDESVKLSEIVIDAIASAEDEIFIAMYSFNINEIRDELGKAADRGVNVQIFYNANSGLNFDEFLGDMKEKFDVRYLGADIEEEREEDEVVYSMHHKFMIVDPDSENPILLTGPYNWSYYQEDLDPNILIKTGDPEIVASYKHEIDRLNFAFSNFRKFHDLDYIPWDKQITYLNGDQAEVWFSPGRNRNSVETRIIDMISSAEKNIDIGVTVFDSYNIAAQIVRMARKGVEVRIIVDVMSEGGDDSMIPWLREKIAEDNLENIEIILGGTAPTELNPEYSIFHYHNLIVDKKSSLIGTANWTYNGFFANDENILIFHNEEIAQKLSFLFDEYLLYQQSLNR